MNSSLAPSRRTGLPAWAQSVASLALGALLSAACASAVRADVTLPSQSQRASVTQRIALTDVTVTYHRPLVNGRKIWGALVPYNDVWRAGADMNTTVEFSSAVTVEGKPLAKGTYGLHMIPTADSSWTVIFSKATTSWGSYTYDQAEDALRVTVKPQPLTENVEALRFDFDDVKASSAVLTLKWEKLAVPMNVAVSNDETLANLRAQVRGSEWFGWSGLNSAAAFCLQNKINLEEALKWVDRSIQSEERFENLSTRAGILAALNRTADASAAEKRAMEKGTALQLYFQGRQMQAQKKNDEALEVFRAVVKRYPEGIYSSLARARLASAKGDFAEAKKEALAAQAAAPSPEQKKAIQVVIDRLDRKEDINK